VAVCLVYLELPPHPNELTTESQSWVKGDICILYQNVSRSSLFCKFIFWFPSVEPVFGHDDSPSESTVIFFGTILGIFHLPKIGGMVKNPVTGYQHSTVPSYFRNILPSFPFVDSEN